MLAPSRSSTRAISASLRLVQRDGGLHERHERLLVDRLSLLEVDRAARVALEARVEQARRILQRGALEEGQLDHLLVRLAGADDAVVLPHRDAAPLPRLDDVGIGPLDQSAQSPEQLAAPVAELLDAPIDQLRGGPVVLRLALRHVATLCRDAV